MHLAANAVPDVFLDNAISVRLPDRGDGGTDVAESIALEHLADP